MGAPDLLQALLSQGLTVWAEGNCVLVAPKARLTEETRTLIREHKAELLRVLEVQPPPNPGSDVRRRRVFEMLANNPAARYAVLAHDDHDSDAVLLTLAIRDRVTCELRIPKNRYDPILLLDLIERYGSTVH